MGRIRSALVSGGLKLCGATEVTEIEGTDSIHEYTPDDLGIIDRIRVGIALILLCMMTRLLPNQIRELIPDLKAEEDPDERARQRYIDEFIQVYSRVGYIGRIRMIISTGILLRLALWVFPPWFKDFVQDHETVA